VSLNLNYRIRDKSEGGLTCRELRSLTIMRESSKTSTSLPLWQGIGGHCFWHEIVGRGRGGTAVYHEHVYFTVSSTCWLLIPDYHMQDPLCQNMQCWILHPEHPRVVVTLGKLGRSWRMKNKTTITGQECKEGEQFV
jgi:hypothetical protein